MSNHEEQKSKVQDQFTKQATSYSKVVESSQTRAVARFDRIEFIQPGRADTVLDIACGTGSFALSLAAHVQWVTGIDLTPAMIEQARLAQQSMNVQNVDWHIGDVSALPFGPNSFSLVVCSAAFHHLDNPLDVLIEMTRVCHPEGRIVINDVTPIPDKRAAFDRMEHLKDPSHTRALTFEELRALGRKAGLAELDATSYDATFPLDLIMKTVFPESLTVEEIRDLYRRDAVDGGDKYGVKARIQGKELWVSYPMGAVLWRKNLV